MLTTKNVVEIMQNTLNCVDPRLMGHGKRVAYMAYKIIKRQNKYDNKQLRDICILSLLHDIGAYKTEEINKMVVFETINVWEHSIYGYLFLKYFSPLKELAPVVYAHHATCKELDYFPPQFRELAQIISLCDRADIYFLTKGGGTEDFKKAAYACEGVAFSREIIDMFFTAGIDLKNINQALDTDEDFLKSFYLPLTQKEVFDYIRMTILSIEFRSPQTSIHTIAATCVAKEIGVLAGLGDEDIRKLTLGGMLHDIGKTGISLHILESPNKLNNDEMAVMKTHVVKSEEIIRQEVAPEITGIAVRHHEKLDGSGYPKGIKGQELSLNERIMAIADIFSALCTSRSYKSSFPQEKVVEILNKMCKDGFIDENIVALSLNNYDYIISRLEKETQPILDIYHKINEEYRQALENVKKLNEGTFTGFII